MLRDSPDQAGGDQTKMQQFAFTYDEAGNLKTANEDNNSYDYTFTYDALNRVETTVQPFGVEMAFEYDAADNRTKVWDNKDTVVESKFDDLNRLIEREMSVSSVNLM